jgi:hypothetical protein
MLVKENELSLIFFFVYKTKWRERERKIQNVRERCETKKTRDQWREKQIDRMGER